MRTAEIWWASNYNIDTVDNGAPHPHRANSVYRVDTLVMLGHLVMDVSPSCMCLVYITCSLMWTTRYTNSANSTTAIHLERKSCPCSKHSTESLFREDAPALPEVAEGSGGPASFAGLALLVSKIYCCCGCCYLARKEVSSHLDVIISRVSLSTATRAYFSSAAACTPLLSRSRTSTRYVLFFFSR